MMKTKLSIFACLMCLFAFGAFSQEETQDQVNYDRWSIDFGFGVNSAIKHDVYAPMYHIGFRYSVSPTVAFGLTGEYGQFNFQHTNGIRDYWGATANTYLNLTQLLDMEKMLNKWAWYLNGGMGYYFLEGDNGFNMKVGTSVNYALTKWLDVKVFGEYTGLTMMGSNLDGTMQSQEDISNFVDANFAVVGAGFTIRLGKNETHIDHHPGMVCAKPEFDYDKLKEMFAAHEALNAAKAKMQDMKKEIETNEVEIEKLKNRKPEVIEKVIDNTVPATILDQLILFNSGSSTLNSEGKKMCGEVASYLKSNSNAKVRVIGNASKDGNKAYNDKLAHNRALSVQKELLSQGVKSSQLEVLGLGSSRPISNSNPKVNRSVVFEKM